MTDKHEFAVYFADLTTEQKEITFSSDSPIYHRLVRVLRLNEAESLVIFNNLVNASGFIKRIDKKGLSVEIKSIKNNLVIKPKITMCISLLKREAFEEALYFCVEYGANEILPVITKKSQAKFNANDRERFEKILISAAEQSKNFALPTFKDPIKLEDIENQVKSAIKIYFDFKGESVSKVFNSLNVTTKDEIFLMIGPEGDLAQEEKNYLKKLDFIFCSLTNTVLRAQSAVSLSLGIFRSYFKF